MLLFFPFFFQALNLLHAVAFLQMHSFINESSRQGVLSVGRPHVQNCFALLLCCLRPFFQHKHISPSEFSLLHPEFESLAFATLKGSAWSIRPLQWPYSIYGDTSSTEVAHKAVAQSCCQGIKFVFIPPPTIDQPCQCVAIWSPPHLLQNLRGAC